MIQHPTVSIFVTCYVEMVIVQLLMLASGLAAMPQLQVLMNQISLVKGVFAFATGLSLLAIDGPWSRWMGVLTIAVSLIDLCAWWSDDDTKKRRRRLKKNLARVVQAGARLVVAPAGS